MYVTANEDAEEDTGNYRFIMTLIFTGIACFSNALSLILMKVSIEKVS